MKEQAGTRGKAFAPADAFPSRSFRGKAVRATALLLCALLLLNLCGCWSKRELDSLAIVLGTALDMGSQPDTLTLTAQVVKAGEIGSGTSVSQSGPESA